MTEEKKKLTAKDRKRVQEEVDYMEKTLKLMRKELELTKKKQAVMESKYSLTPQGRDNAVMEYQTDAEYRALALEIDKIGWELENMEREYKINQQEPLLSAKKKLLAERS